ncbi:TetR/AcrR family transcriptional regulator C-terminal domain-containing protein [Actinomadura nitritigenes]|uniref:TetR/AcrR family transcriptional regulator C-terminal domain-containing protein n=1 Tax=Actinomadura nitritigenes TaxID=134602 RepID=UPI003D8BF9E1
MAESSEPPERDHERSERDERDRPERGDRTEPTERAEHAGRRERSENAERAERPARGERGERAERRERARPNDIWARPRGGRRPKLTREAIVDKAVEIADAEGLEAVSIRRVASELGVRAMSLYTHIEAKEDLLDLMYDVVAVEVLVEDGLPDDWREAMIEITRKERAAGLRHPWMFELAGRSPRIGPNGLRHAEQSMAAAARLTDDPEEMLAIVTTVDHYMLGFVLREQRLREMGTTGLGEARQSALEQTYIAKLLESGEFPHLRSVLDTGIYNQEDFDLGLKWLLDGIEHDHRGKWPSTSSPT